MQQTRYSFPTNIHFGPQSILNLSHELKSQKLKRPIIITDKGLADSKIIQNIKKSLLESDLSCTVFSEIWGNPVESQVKAGVISFHKQEADSIIAVGGGAAMDVAKAIALMVNHPGQIFDYEDGIPHQKPFDKPLPFLVAVPTTAGTGSEVGRSTVISDEITKVKRIIFHPRLMPSLVLADPELLLNLPANLTAATGMDALSHLMESFLAPQYHPICDGIALEGIRLVSQSLKQCVIAPQDLEARSSMMNAAMMGAIAFQKGLGVTHSCAHALSTVCDTHHGLANGVMLPYCMEFNLRSVPERFARIAQAIGQKDPIVWIRELKTEIGIPKTLSEIGVKKDHMASLVEFALIDGCHKTNPRPVGKQDFIDIFNAAYAG